MGLDTTHDCWHGSYGTFGLWRTRLAEVAGLPPLELMEGFYDPDSGIGLAVHLLCGKGADDPPGARTLTRLPIKWACLKPDPLYILLDHSDCDGSIQASDCEAIAARLEELAPLMDKDDKVNVFSMQEKTRQFAAGLRAAAAANENVEFH